MAKKDIYQEVTDRIVKAIENNDVQDWIKPWTSEERTLPQNFITGKEYRGVNVLLLWIESLFNGYQYDLWATFKQIKARGGSVLKGSKSTEIVFFKVDEKEIKRTVTKDNGEIEEVVKKEKKFILRYYRVFNIAQTDLNLADFGIVEGEKIKFNPIEAAEKYIKNVPHRTEYGFDRAFYRRAEDFIGLPNAENFVANDAYYATYYHELVHWTGHKDRTDREFGKRFGDDAYAAEELVAELGSAFVCAKTGIEGELQHKDYIAHWLKVLKQDNRAIFTAATKAHCAVDYLDGFQK